VADLIRTIERDEPFEVCTCIDDTETVLPSDELDGKHYGVAVNWSGAQVSVRHADGTEEEV